MNICILRHGKAEDRMQTVTSDSKRKLTEAGKKELLEIAKGIKNLEIEFDFIVSSPLVRAQETATIVLKQIKPKKKSILVWDELKPEIDTRETIKKLATLSPTSSILLVGHEPHLSTLISQLISGSENSDISLKKGGFAHIRGNLEKSEINGSLRTLMTPKQLKLCK